MFSFDVSIKIIRPFHPSFQHRCETSDPTNTADVWHCQCNFICMFWRWQWCSSYWNTNCKWKDQTMKVHMFLTFLTGTILLFGSDFHWESSGNYSSFTVSHAFRGISYPNHAALKQASCSWKSTEMTVYLVELHIAGFPQQKHEKCTVTSHSSIWVLSRGNQIHWQAAAIKGTFESLLVIVMKMSLLPQSKHIDRLLKSPNHSRSVSRGICAEVEVMSTSGQNILVPAFRLHSSVHIILLEYIIKSIDLISHRGDHVPPERT